MGKSLQIRPDFTEELVGFMIQSMLTIIRFPRAPFALIPMSKKHERIYGADARIEALCPLYIQFKRSFAYPKYSTAGFIKDRKRLNTNCHPIALYFDLRVKRPSHKDFQHNVLFDLKTELDKTGKGKAFYTAPLFLNRTAYLLAVHMSSILNWRPWHWTWKDPFINDHRDIITQTGTIRFQNIPILREHIVIPPHIKVNTHKHRYSYLESGREICFHDPTILEDESNLGQVIYDFIRSRDGKPTTEMYNLEESLDLLSMLSSLIGTGFPDGPIIERWLNFGDALSREYEIYQFLLLKFKEE